MAFYVKTLAFVLFTFVIYENYLANASFSKEYSQIKLLIQNTASLKEPSKLSLRSKRDREYYVAQCMNISNSETLMRSVVDHSKVFERKTKSFKRIFSLPFS